MGNASRRGISILVLVAYLLACVAMGWFGWFLWAGPHPVVKLGLETPGILAFDALLALAFFLQHSGMIRKSFRARFAALLPAKYQPLLYALATDVVLLLLLMLWQPSGVGLAKLEGPLAWLVRAIFFATLAGMVWAFSSLKQFDPIGVGALVAHPGSEPAAKPSLIIRGPYRWVRHPIYSSFILMVWASPEMSTDRLMFDILWSLWMVAATHFEERDLAAEFGEAYRKYQRTVPMLVPVSLRPRA